MNQPDKKSYLYWAPIAVIAIGLFAILCLPFILTQYSSGIIFNDKTGSIGDTIGGIAGPIAGAMGAILAYFAFRIQYDANVFQASRIDRLERHQELVELEEMLNDAIKRFLDEKLIVGNKEHVGTYQVIDKILNGYGTTDNIKAQLKDNRLLYLHPAILNYFEILDVLFILRIRWNSYSGKRKIFTSREADFYSRFRFWHTKIIPATNEIFKKHVQIDGIYHQNLLLDHIYRHNKALDLFDKEFIAHKAGDYYED